MTIKKFSLQDLRFCNRLAHTIPTDVYIGTGCFDGTFSLQVIPDSKPDQVALRCVASVLQKPFKEEIEQLQQQDIIRPLGMSEMAEWCSSLY